MIIYRYIKKEVLFTSIGVTTLAVFIFMVNMFGHYMTFLVSGKYAMNVVMHLVMLEVPILFGVFLPFGLYLGFLLSYGRLYADSEMTVLKACGFGQRQLLTVTWRIAFLTAIFISILVMWVMPIANQHRDSIINMASQASAFQMLTPGRFVIEDDDNQVMYVKEMAPNRKHVTDVFVAEKMSDKQKPNANHWAVITAKKGRQYDDPKTGDQFVMAENGYRYEGVPGQKDFKVVKFDEYAMRVNTPAVEKPLESEGRSMDYLFRHQEDLQNKAELQWRLSFPISAFLLAMIALPLSRVRVRQGRFGQLFPAVLVYIIYVNLIFASRNWLLSGQIPSWLGLWWVHGVMFVFAMILYQVRRDM
jgi:lipopolysaccharide export system permease protein